MNKLDISIREIYKGKFVLTITNGKHFKDVRVDVTYDGDYPTIHPEDTDITREQIDFLFGMFNKINKL